MSIGLVGGLQNGDNQSVINTPWIDFSEQSTIVGWSSFTNKSIRYKQIGNIVYVSVRLQGTSNATSLSFTLPIPTKSIGTEPLIAIPYAYTADNGNPFMGYITIPSLNSNIFVASRFSAISTTTATYTASGTKALFCQFFYEI